MPKNELMELDKLIEICTHQHEDSKESAKRARSRRRKKQNEYAEQFFKSLANHLIELKNLKESK